MINKFATELNISSHGQAMHDAGIICVFVFLLPVVICDLRWYSGETAETLFSFFSAVASSSVKVVALPAPPCTKPPRRAP